MRKRHAFILVFTLILLNLPTVVLAATDEWMPTCPFGAYTLPINTEVPDEDAVDTPGHGSNADEVEAAKEEAFEAYGEWLVENEELFSSFYNEDTCGKPNSVTGYIEKGDCSAAGKVVTEITEVIAPDVVLEAGTENENKIVTVYGGICCILPAEDTSGNYLGCEETATFYTPDYESCDDALESCKKRQWVIGSSGIGLVKLMVKQIFTFGALSVGSIAVGTIVFQGIKISVSGVSGDISDAKTKILQAIGGIVLLFLSGLILLAINPEFFG